MCVPWKHLKAGTASVIVLAGLTSACGGRDHDGKISTPDAVTVATATAEVRPIAEQLTVSSELIPFQQIDVYAKEAGYVKSIAVDYGSHVRAGQVMAVLEIPEMEAQIREDSATIQARLDEVTREERQVERAKAQRDVLHLQYTRLAGVAKTEKG